MTSAPQQGVLLHNILSGIFSTVFNEQGTGKHLQKYLYTSGVRHNMDQMILGTVQRLELSVAPAFPHRQEGCMCASSGGEGVCLHGPGEATSVTIPQSQMDTVTLLTKKASESSSLLWQPWTRSAINMSNLILKLTSFCLWVIFTHWLP